MKIRLQRFLANAGVASRRASEKIILSGRVQVNGRIVRELGFKIDPDVDEIKVDGKICHEEQRHIYIMMNKPAGVVTTVKDPFGRPTVIDIIKGLKERVYPVGRLDMDTEGLLILTNDGEVTYRLTHPKHEVEKTYLAHVKGMVTRRQILMLEMGIKLEDGLTAPAKVRIVKRIGDSTVLEIKIHEGKKRQVRRMCSAIGNPVIHLKRTHIGNLSLNNLKPGQWRFMTAKEIEYIKNL
ncbi:MAG TPA: rRNA pseudouridine synthase [Thermoanaerobacterales bacterium]|nr:rRNA pseudouridine synthase [Thermoanaerobacterales bacterium]